MELVLRLRIGKIYKLNFLAILSSATYPYEL